MIREKYFNLMALRNINIKVSIRFKLYIEIMITNMDNTIIIQGRKSAIIDYFSLRD